MKTEKEATDWFYGKAKSAAGYRRNIIERNPGRDTGDAVIGRMYFFYYDPKLKNKLPMYDRFPLVFPIEKYSDGFLGLNLHYLTTSERQVLLGKLMSFRNNNKLNKITRLKMSYDLLQKTKAFGLVRPCIKRYLFSQVRSSFIEIYADEWENAIALPVESFVYKR